MVEEIEEGRRVLRIEAQAIVDLAERLDERFVTAVDLICGGRGKVICTGIGKSGHIARKVASTFSSTGTPAVYLHPAESSHGDLGLIANDDVVVAFSYGGESEELMPILKFAARRGIPVIAVTGHAESSLAKSATVTLDSSVKEEACPLGLAPTTSSTASLAIGDALCMAVLKKRGFTKDDFAEFHPGGKLGRRLVTRVRDLMRTGPTLPFVGLSEPMAEVVGIMTATDVPGVAGVLDEGGSLVGVITDGDIRRRLRNTSSPLVETARELMSKGPKTIDADELALRALFVMEQFKIQHLFVLEKTAPNPRKPIGIVSLQDLIRAKLT